MTKRQNIILGGWILLFFLGVLCWAKEQDPFVRKWFTLKTAKDNPLACFAILPKSAGSYPLVVYAHGSGGNLINDGDDLRPMAELGLAVVSFSYDQNSVSEFNSQFESLLHYLRSQKWVNTNAIAWVGFSLGANQMWNFAQRHREQQPQFLVQLSGRGWGTNEATISGLNLNPRSPIQLVHGEQDNVFPVDDTRRLASILQTNHFLVELNIIPHLPHNLVPERGLIFRIIGESCLAHLNGHDWQNYQSIAQWQAAAPRLWIFCIPSAIYAGWFGWRQRHRFAPASRNTFTVGQTVLRRLAWILATGAVIETAIHLVTPCFPVTEGSLAMARHFLVTPKDRHDFEFLAAQSLWRGQPLRTLLMNADLASYNRGLVRWKTDENIYQNYVLSPVINNESSNHLNWRRPLWEEFYPRVRNEALPATVAGVVARHLRERVTVADIPQASRDVSTIWRRQITDATGFDILYVAALRSIGVPARLDRHQQSELWDGDKWQLAPRPSLLNY